MTAYRYKEILDHLQRTKQIDLHRYRQSVIERRLAARMAFLNIDNIDVYTKYIHETPAECDLLLDYIAINVSSFFRNPSVFDYISHSVFPSCIERKQKEGCSDLRIWSAGCATGEEPYSIAMLLHQDMKKKSPGINSFIFATDIDTQALDAARKGIYPREKCKDMKLGFFDAYFSPVPEGFAISLDIKNMVHISCDDLTSSGRVSPAESIFGAFDLILCRNVLIYFSQELQEFVLDKLHQSLAPEGYLVLGESESINKSRDFLFKTVDRVNRIYMKR